MRPGTAIAAVLMLVPLMAVSGSSLAQRRFGPPDGGGHMADFLQRNAEELGLDDETTEAIQRVMQESRKRARGLDDALHEARLVMRDLLEQDVPDEATVMRQAEVIGEIEIERNKHRLATLIRIRSFLTPEQRALLVHKREDRRQAILEACADDFEALCPGAQAGPELFRCLRSHREDLSDGCRDAMPGPKHGRPGFPHRPFGR